MLWFLLVAATGVALVFLLRWTNKHFRTISPDPEGSIGGNGQRETASQETPK